MNDNTNNPMPERRPVERTSLGFRLDLRHRFAWRLADRASTVQQIAGWMQERAAKLSRGEITPVLPIHLDQLEHLADLMDVSVIDLVDQIDWVRVHDGRHGKALGR